MLNRNKEKGKSIVNIPIALDSVSDVSLIGIIQHDRVQDIHLLQLDHQATLEGGEKMDDMIYHLSFILAKCVYDKKKGGCFYNIGPDYVKPF